MTDRHVTVRRVESFEGRLAVLTGGGTGMGREIVLQLAAEGCSIAMCDVLADNMGETALRAAEVAPEGTRITTHLCDVSDAGSVERFKDEVVAQHNTDHVNLLFNNAGIGGGGSFVEGPRDEWERTFAVCWGGVYNCARSFMPLLVASDEGCIVNTSSVNGFWASLGPGIPHTAYSAAKFAVKGFTEALMEDLKVNAPHVKAFVVMPGHIGTDIVINSRKILRNVGDEIGDDEVADARELMSKRGFPVEDLPDDQVRAIMKMMGEGFRDTAPMSARDAASVILGAVRRGEWRILVGDDARKLDEAVRKDPVAAYDGLTLASIAGVMAPGGDS
jgi:NAD(P)-dependent dehydrogenase (short-subunit alcohol dehydrogenase family)